jgi:predicted dehydrogenase
MEKVRWGILSTAAIAMGRVIPAMQAQKTCDLVAISSRDLGRAKAAAASMGIPKAYGSYDEMLADPEIEAVYIGLPNSMHLEWVTRAAEAGKHVLCEKPLTMTADEARRMIEVRNRTGVLMEEAFQPRNHPQWHEVRRIVRSGRIGRVMSVQAAFSHSSLDLDDIRNKRDMGGGSIYDIGCYPTTMFRYLLEDEPERVMVMIKRDPVSDIDAVTSVMLQFPKAQASWTATIQAARHQSMVVLGSEGWLRLEIPFTPRAEDICRIHITGHSNPGSKVQETIELPLANHYGLQGHRFSRLVRGEAVDHWPLETALDNMKILDAYFRSEQSGAWETV